MPAIMASAGMFCIPTQLFAQLLAWPGDRTPIQVFKVLNLINSTFNLILNLIYIFNLITLII